MLGKCQIVPALASAVHGAIEELPHLPETPSPQLNRSRIASSISSTTSPQLINTDANHFRLSSISTTVLSSSSQYSRTTPQLDVRKAFAYFDKNRDGKLSIKEFKSVMHDLGYKTVDKRCIKQMFAEANRNGNGRTLGYDEFVEFLNSKLSLQTPVQQATTTTTTRSSFLQEMHSPSLPKLELDVETLFNCYDLDKNGFIEPKELRKVMKRLTGEKLSKRDIEEMISVADKNGDGLLDKSEFALLCSAF
jgi:Ca2+-binding EF-hand superfamily protein